MNTAYDAMSMNQMGQMPAGNPPAQSPFASPASMSPLAMNQMMGNPMANQGANMSPYQQGLSMMAQTGSQMNANNYARGGYVQMAMGGNPADAMMQQGGGAPPDPSQGMGGISSKGPLAESIKEGDPEQAPLAEVANALDLGDDTQLTFINQEELQALTQMGGEPPQMAQDVAPDPALVEQLMQGVEGEDYILVYLSQEQFNALIQQFGEPTINQASGLPQFGFFKSVVKAVKSVVKNPIVQAVAPLALNAFAPGLGAALGGALGLGSMGTSALISGGLGLLGGGGIKGGLKGAALGALGQGVGDYLSSGTNPFSGMMGGGTEAGTGFGLSTGAPSTPGLNANPTGSGIGLQAPSAGLTPTANSIAGAAPKTGLASLLPTSTAGKLALGAGALTLAGGLGGQKQETSGPPLQQNDPNFSKPLQLQELNRVRRPEFRPDYSIAQDASDRTYFDDKFVPVTPGNVQTAARGGMMMPDDSMQDLMYADGGEVMHRTRKRKMRMRDEAMSDEERDMQHEAMMRGAMTNQEMGHMGRMPEEIMSGRTGGLGQALRSMNGMGSMSDADRRMMMEAMQREGMTPEPPLGLGGSRLAPMPPQGGQGPGFNQTPQGMSGAPPHGGMPPMPGSGAEPPMGGSSPLSQQMVANLFAPKQGMRHGGLAYAMGGMTPDMYGMYNMQAMNGMNQNMYAMGGMTSYGGGGLLQDGSDGVADDIPATIGGKQPAKLSGGEFIVPSRIVSELGNGNTEAGAKKLYGLIDKVDKKRRSMKDYAGDSQAAKTLMKMA